MPIFHLCPMNRGGRLQVVYVKVLNCIGVRKIICEA